MKIESIRLKNYKVFRDVHLKDIPSFLVVVGANGSGKSTLFDVFGFLHDCLKGTVRQALDKRGRFRDENNCPAIMEYKRSVGENVINQGLFYLDWLMDHRGDFERLVTRQLGHETADGIDWSAPRLVCIAADFTKYDAHAVQQIGRNIELIRYRMFGDDLLLLELVNATSVGSGVNTGAKGGKLPKAANGKEKVASGDKTYAEWLESISDPLRELLASLEDYIVSLGDDVQKKELKLYAAFKRLKNFATVVLQKNRLVLYLHLTPTKLGSLPAIARDVSQSGHWGTGDLELVIASAGDLDLAKPLVRMAYEGRGSVGENTGACP